MSDSLFQSLLQNPDPLPKEEEVPTVNKNNKGLSSKKLKFAFNTEDEIWYDTKSGVPAYKTA